MIITVANAKGGVGKTTVSANLSAALASNKKGQYKVCAVDFDFQSNLTHALIEKNTVIGPCMYDILGGHNPDIVKCIYPTIHPRLDLIPSVVELSGLEIGLYADFPDSNLIFRNYAREYLLQHYDFIICDVGPSLNIFLNQALCASDGVFVVAEVGSANSMVNIETVIKHIMAIKEENEDLKHMKIIMNKLNRTRAVDKVNISRIHERFNKEDCFDTIIPVSADFRAVEEKQNMTIIQWKPSSKGSVAFRALSKEVANEFLRKEKESV